MCAGVMDRPRFSRARYSRHGARRSLTDVSSVPRVVRVVCLVPGCYEPLRFRRWPAPPRVTAHLPLPSRPAASNDPCVAEVSVPDALAVHSASASGTCLLLRLHSPKRERLRPNGEDAGSGTGRLGYLSGTHQACALARRALSPRLGLIRRCRTYQCASVRCACERPMLPRCAPDGSHRTLSTSRRDHVYSEVRSLDRACAPRRPTCVAQASRLPLQGVPGALRSACGCSHIKLATCRLLPHDVPRTRD